MTLHANTSTEKWQSALARFLPTFLGEHPILAGFRGRMSVVLHGSTTMGIDDPFSDLDFWLLMRDDAVADFDRASPTRFISFVLDGKEGHLNITPADEFADRVAHCDFDLIYQLRRAVVFADEIAVARTLQESALRPMRPEVRHAWFFWHYVGMRGEHRACDNPMQRVDPPAILLSLTKTLSHALRAAMILDGEPYPYDKWLYLAARETPGGARVAASVDRIVDLLGEGLLSFTGGETRHPISLELRVIRRTLIDAARAGGINEPWLEKWWLFMDQSCVARKTVTW